MDPDNPRSELFVEEWEMFNSILVDSLNDEEEISAESLIIKEDPLWKHNDSINDEDSTHYQYILPKFIRCYACNPKLKCLKQRTCTIATEIQINELGKSLEKATLTGTAFLISPFQKDSTNYLLTCANRVSSHKINEDIETMVKKM